MGMISHEDCREDSVHSKLAIRGEVFKGVLYSALPVHLLCDSVQWQHISSFDPPSPVSCSSSKRHLPLVFWSFLQYTDRTWATEESLLLW